MGSTDTNAVVATRGRSGARVGQIQQDGGCRRSADVLASTLGATDGSESIRQVGKLLEASSVL